MARSLVDVDWKQTFPLDRPDSIDALVFRMEQLGLRQKDVAELSDLTSIALPR